MVQTSQDTARLFLALWPEAIILAALQHWRDHWSWRPKAWLARPESLHLTLHFLGDVPRTRLPELVLGLAVPFAPFELTLGRSQIWPNGVAVLEPDAIPADLLRLHAELAVALQKLAIPVEARPYHPHVTLARRAQGATPPVDGAPVRWPVRNYALMESQFAPARGYRLVQSYSSDASAQKK